MNEVAAVLRQVGAGTVEAHPLAAPAQLQQVEQADLVHQGFEGVVPVRPPPGDPEKQVDLGRRPDRKNLPVHARPSQPQPSLTNRIFSS